MKKFAYLLISRVCNATSISIVQENEREGSSPTIWQSYILRKTINSIYLDGEKHTISKIREKPQTVWRESHN